MMLTSRAHAIINYSDQQNGGFAETGYILIERGELYLLIDKGYDVGIFADSLVIALFAFPFLHSNPQNP